MLGFVNSGFRSVSGKITRLPRFGFHRSLDQMKPHVDAERISSTLNSTEQFSTHHVEVLFRDGASNWQYPPKATSIYKAVTMAFAL